MRDKLQLTCELLKIGTSVQEQSMGDTRFHNASIQCRLSGPLELMQYLLRLASSLGLSLQVGRGRTAGEETGEQWLDEGVEDDLGAAIRMLELYHANH